MAACNYILPMKPREGKTKLGHRQTAAVTCIVIVVGGRKGKIAEIAVRTEGARTQSTLPPLHR